MFAMLKHKQMCNSHVESTQHLFFEWFFTLQVLYSCYAWFGISTVVPINCTKHFWLLIGLVLRKGPRKVWGIVWVAMVWSVWLERNFLIFKDEIISTEDVLDLIKLRLWLWCKARVKCFIVTYHEWSTFLKLTLNGLQWKPIIKEKIILMFWNI